MKRPNTIIEALAKAPWFLNQKIRRSALAAIALLLAGLSVWPRPYLASSMIAPDDSAAGLTGLFSGGGGINLISSLLGGRGTIEANLLVGRSNSVFTAVSQRLKKQGYYTDISVERLNAKLRRKVKVEAQRGSILEISIEDYDPKLAKQIVENFVIVLRQRLTVLSRQQAAAKQTIASERMEEATRQYEEAKRVLDAYRASHNFTNPEVQQGVSQGSYVGLQAELKASETTLRYLEKTLGPENIQLQNARDRVQVLAQQIANLETKPGSGSIQSLSKISPEVAKYKDLLRNEGFAQGRYDIYKRYLESLSVQEIAAPLNIAVLDPPFIDPQRQYNAIPLGLLALLIVFGIFAEFYIASRPDLSRRDDRAGIDDDEGPNAPSRRIGDL